MSLSVALAPSTTSCTGSLAPRTLSALGASRLRVTVSQIPVGKTQPALLCDRLISLGDSHADLDLDLPSTGRVDLRVEVYSDGAPMPLLASGGLVGLNLRPRLRPLQVLVSPVAQPACTLGLVQTARAFHSATVLPNGEVLLVGGVTTEPPTGTTSTEGQLFMVRTVEIYDPQRGIFRQAADLLSSGRALHSALLLSGEVMGPYDLLLVGGLTTTASDKPGLQLATGAALPLLPGTEAMAASSVILRYYPWTDPPKVVSMAGSPQLKTRMLHTLGLGQSGEGLLLGGLIGQGSTGLSTVDDFELLAVPGSSAHTGAFPLKEARVGAMAAPLSATEILVFGGNLKSPASELASRSAEVITLGTSPASAAATFEKTSQNLVSSVAHATLSPVGSDQLLLVGGLTVEAGQAVKLQPTRPILRISRVGSELRLTEVPSSAFGPAAYHRDTVLSGGDLVLSGGLPAACDGGASFCGSSGLAVFQKKDGALRKEKPLLHARLGHQATLLPDGTLLITGGLHHDGTALSTHKTAELYSPAVADPYGRVPGAVKNPCP